MRKLTFILLSVASLTAVSWAMETADIPSQLTLAGFAGTVQSSGEKLDLNGPWVQSWEWDYGEGYRGKRYTNSSGFTAQIIRTGESVILEANSGVFVSPPGGGTPQPTWRVQYGNNNGTWFASPLQNIPEGPPGSNSGTIGITMDTNSLTSANFANGITAGGYLVGGAAPEGWGQLSGGGGGTGGSPTPTPAPSSASPQVTQSTDGLILQEGQFYPLFSQPQ